MTGDSGSAGQTRRHLVLRLLTTALTCSACQAQRTAPAAGPIGIDIRVDRNAISILAVDRADTPRAVAPTRLASVERLLYYQLRGDQGAVLASGSTTDPRAVHAELEDGDELVRVEVQSGVGVATLRLPAMAGDLVMAQDLKADGSLGRVVGQVRFDPDLGLRSPTLLEPSDVLGSPVLFVDHGEPDTHLNLLFLPDGYREEQMNAFHRDAAELMDRLLAHPNFQGYADRFNAWYLDVRSRDAGVDDPDAGISVDTAFDASMGRGDLHRAVTVGDAAAEKIWQLARAAGADVVIVLVNSDQHGGTAGQWIVMTRRGGLNNALPHELGHRLFGLGDEYDYPGDDCDVSRYWNRMPLNVSPVGHGSGIPWHDLIRPETPLPTPDQAEFSSTVGAFAGASYCLYLYRPQRRCLMRELDARFCAVCRREMARFFERFDNP